MDNQDSPTVASAGPLKPQALDAEKSILCAMLLDADSIEMAIEQFGQDGEAFFKLQHRKIYQGIVRLADEGQSPDLITLRDALARVGDLDASGGTEYLSSIFDFAVGSANVQQHIKLVKEKYLLRRLIQEAHSIIMDAQEGRDSGEEVLDRAEARIFALGEQRLSTGFRPMSQLVHPAMTRIQELYERKEHITGVPTGFTDLDNRTAGLQPSDLIIVAGRPGMGKTSFALNMAENAALLSGKHVGVFSLEMSSDQLVQRLLASNGRIDMSKLRRGYLTDPDWRSLARAAGAMNVSTIFIDETPGVTVLDVRTRARRLKAEHGLDLLVIDYLQLMRSNERAENRALEVSQMTRSLKGLAKELNIPIVLLSQLSRATEASERRSKIPQLSDLRESGAIEQDADIVLFVFREEMYKPEVEELKNKAQVIIAKHRNGPTGIVNLTFLKESTRFENYTEIQAEYLS
jgi:replicative DNA helicase